MKKLSLYLLSAIALVFWNCNTDFDEPVEEQQITSGEADFSRFVSLGNSLTAGFADNALYISGQENSFPNMLADLMAEAGGGSFTQPLMQDDIGGFTNLGLSGRVRLQIVNGAAAPVASAAQTALDNIAAGGPYNNMGIPGAKSFHLLAPGYGNPAGLALGAANPYFVRFASSPTTTVLADAAAQNPTFFTVWIGANDVLSYALAGGTGINQAGNTDPSTYGGSDISDPNVVAGSINAVLNTLTASGAKGAIANIPAVTSVPFFTTVPWNAVPLDMTQANAANAGYAAYNAGINQLAALGMISAAEAAARQISFAPGANAPVFIDSDLTNLTGVNPALVSMRQATADELVLLTALPSLQTGVGVTSPLPNSLVLTVNEIANITSATNAFNSAIAGLATTYDLALVDANARLAEVENQGLVFNGVDYSTTFVSGGVFSLDGFHPSKRGYAIIANEFVEAINAKYGSNLRTLNPNAFPGIDLP